MQTNRCLMFITAGRATRIEEKILDRLRDEFGNRVRVCEGLSRAKIAMEKQMPAYVVCYYNGVNASHVEDVFDHLDDMDLPPDMDLRPQKVVMFDSRERNLAPLEKAVSYDNYILLNADVPCEIGMRQAFGPGKETSDILCPVVAEDDGVQKRLDAVANRKPGSWAQYVNEGGIGVQTAARKQAQTLLPAQP